jgi:hypothetical protein
VGSIFLIIGAAVVLFAILTLAMKRTDPPLSPDAIEEKKRECSICHEEFFESDMITRKVGGAGYVRFFCDRCVIELYEESRLLHDPRSKE